MAFLRYFPLLFFSNSRSHHLSLKHKLVAWLCFILFYWFYLILFYFEARSEAAEAAVKLIMWPRITLISDIPVSCYVNGFSEWDPGWCVLDTDPANWVTYQGSWNTFSPHCSSVRIFPFLLECTHLPIHILKTFFFWSHFSCVVWGYFLLSGLVFGNNSK